MTWQFLKNSFIRGSLASFINGVGEKSRFPFCKLSERFLKLRGGLLVSGYILNQSSEMEYENPPIFPLLQEKLPPSQFLLENPFQSSVSQK